MQSARLRSLLPMALGILIVLACNFATAAEPKPDFKKDIEPILERHCFDCHGDGMDKGEMSLDTYKSLEEHFQNRDLWMAVWKNVRTQLMPPSNKKQPPDEQRQLITRWIEREVFKLDPKNPDPGRVTIRRLNREEYRNTIDDLFGIEFDTTEAFPADDTGYGFDTIGDVLSLSPLLMEKYLEAAREIVSGLVNTPGPRTPTLKVAGDEFHCKADPKISASQLPFAKAAMLECAKAVEHPGPYQITVELRVRGSEEATTHTANLALKQEGGELERRHLSWDNRRSISLTAKADLQKGTNVLGLEVLPGHPPGEGENELHLEIEEVLLHGPLDGSYREYPKEYYRVFFDGPPPAEPQARRDYARRILRHFGDRVFRRPIEDNVLNQLVSLAEQSQSRGAMSFEQSVGQALTAMLASSRFLFRAEIQPEPNNSGRVVPVDEYALASRLSYFLWSSMPDDELFALAAKGKLRANLISQVDRMLEDRRSRRFIRNFTGQWLQTRDVESINVNPRRILRIRNEDEAFRIFNRDVRRGMRQETEMLFAHLLKENRPADELLVADYTFLNEPLAKFYKIPGVSGREMQKVALTNESHRGGLLTHGSFLLVTSNPTRTSPVKRGLFVLENILGSPAPPPPPNVPELEEVRREQGEDLTMRQLMEIHREKPLCASCHARMDPLGLALENFNALGMWRDTEYGQQIDTTGQLITGEKFSDPRELAEILVSTRRKDFYRCLTEKLLTYAIGRGMEYYDAPTVDKIVAEMENEKGHMRALLDGVVNSAPFQMRRGDGEWKSAQVGGQRSVVAE